MAFGTHLLRRGGVQLRSAPEVSPQAFERVDLLVHPLVLELTGKTAACNGLEGQFSVFHSAAVALLDGAGTEAKFSDARVNAPEVVALRERCTRRSIPR